MRGVSSCWTPAENSQFHGRTPQPLRTAGSYCASGSAVPNCGLYPWHSPFAAGLNRLQSGKLFPVSTTLMTADDEIDTPGFSESAVAIDSWALPLTAAN